MPTTKDRISISVNKDTYWAIKQLAKAAQVPIATATLKLLEKGIEMEMEKDNIWTQIRSERTKHNS